LAVLLNDEELCGSLTAIFARALEHNPDPSLRPYMESVGMELREKWIAGAAAGMDRIYRYFKTQRLIETDSNPTTFRRTTPKIGRNDPCPCGSGKKFKHGCGKITLQ